MGRQQVSALGSKLALVSALSLAFVASGALAAAGEVTPATAAGRFGLYPASDFRIGDGQCKDCAAPPAALWYFRNETLALPKQGAEGFVRGARAFEDVQQNAKQNAAAASASRPSLLWIGASQQVSGARLDKDGKRLKLLNGQYQPFALTAKIDTNRSYFDASSLQHFAGRPLNLRGEMVGKQFVGRTLWPTDYALDFAKLNLQPLQAGETLDALIRAEQGGAKSAMSARLLWQRDSKAPRTWADKPVLAAVLNGAQGDDDEALGGHFAIATGRFSSKGEWGDWIVNNFYNLDSASEKGIIASSLPLDTYQGDLNSGQSWYRPSYFMAAVLKDERAAAQYQQAISRVFNHFYRHDFTYQHATANCAGLSIETLRALGWEIPKQGPTSRLKAIAALPVMSFKDKSLESGKKAVDYLMAEQTSLYPMVAFQAASNDLLTRVVSGKVETAYEKQLAEDLEAVIFIRIPQFPSSRAFGNAPVASIDEYMATAPADRADWKTAPAGPRPFPAELVDPESPAPELTASSWTVAGYGGFLGFGTLGFWHRRKKKRQQGAQKGAAQ